MGGKKNSKGKVRVRRAYSRELKEEAVQMLLEGHSAKEVTDRLGLSGPWLLTKWKAQILKQGGQAAVSLDTRTRELEEQLRRVERERDILKKALAIFSQRI